MIQYEYQVLRFTPDQAVGEFANVGFVIYCAEERSLDAKFIQKIGRIHSFFSGINARHILDSLKYLEEAIYTIADRLKNELAYTPPTTITEITSSLIRTDNSSLEFTKPQSGIDISLRAATRRLMNIYLNRFDSEIDKSEVLRDVDVWRKIYKQYFDEVGVREKLHPYEVKTKYKSIVFDYSWKNEIQHCYEPVSFDLKKESQLINKVYSWVGKLQKIKKSEEAIHLNFLTILPQDTELKDFVVETLKAESTDKYIIDIIEPYQAESLANETKKAIELHDEME